MSMDSIGGIVGLVLTVLILSYLIDDNPLYRLALHILIGASVGYAVAIALFAVVTRVLAPALVGGSPPQYDLLVPALFGVLLLFKSVPRLAAWGNAVTAFLIGVGAAVAMAGALIGTIVPQVAASGSLIEWLQLEPWSLLSRVILTGGTICALLAFSFTIRRQKGVSRPLTNLVSFAGYFGQIFLLSAFGAAFAAALTASLSILIGRYYFLAELLAPLLPG
jgi:hypothetical protein